MPKPAVEGDWGEQESTGPDPLVGKVLDGRFRIVERLGSGGMGTVYKAIQTPLERMVALKILNSNYDARRDPGFQRRFFLEASVTSKLRHPNTITVIDYGKTEDGIYYLAMEYVEGVTLAQVMLAQGAISWQRSLGIAQQICRSLREAHRAGIVHRDLKPANVMICSEETDQDLIKVLDFGLVKAITPDKQQSPAEITQAGVFLGSPQYMAPEQARNIADPRSDIYSLGVVTYQMMLGKPPFFAEQSIEVIVKHMKEAPPSFKVARPDLDIPPEVEALVMRCLEKDPNRRFQSMEEVLEAIRSVSAAGASGIFSGSRSFPPTPSPMSQISQSGIHRQATPQTPSGPQHIPPSGVHKLPSGPHKIGSGVYAASQLPGNAMEIKAEDSRALNAVMSAARPIPHSRKLVPMGIFLGSLAVGLVIVFLLVNRRPPQKPPEPPPSTGTATVTPPPNVPATSPGTAPANPGESAADPGTTAPAAPRTVLFRVQSEPLGATVAADGKVVGTTPFTFELSAGPDGSASTQLHFQLQGYEGTSVTAAGTGPEVFVTQRLRKAAAPSHARHPPDKKPKVTGYKDDPY